MIEVTNKAAAVLKAAKVAKAARKDAGIRIQRSALSEERNAIAVSFVVSDEPQSGDDAFEQHGLRIFVEDALVQRLDGHTLDVDDGGEMPELVFR